MSGAAHHLDLRTPNQEFDPIDVVIGRNMTINYLNLWIASHYNI